MRYKTLPVFITRRQAATLAGVSTRTVTNRISTGAIESIKDGGCRRILASAYLTKYKIPEADALRVLNAEGGANDRLLTV